MRPFSGLTLSCRRCSPFLGLLLVLSITQRLPDICVVSTQRLLPNSSIGPVVSSDLAASVPQISHTTLSFLPYNHNVRADPFSGGIAISTEWSFSN